MSIPLVINGVSYDFPEPGDQKWGADVTAWAAAVTSGMLQKSGGLFQLLAEADFGSGFGLKSLYYKTRTSNPADAGQFRLARADVINWRNNANSANLSLGVSASDVLQFNGSNIQGELSVTDTATIDLTLSSNVLSADIKAASIVNSMISASAAIAYSKLALTGSIVNADLANMSAATIKGRASGSGSGAPVDLSATQATAILDNVVGDSGAGGTKGLVPAPAAGDAAANKFLKADGTWVAPSGAGDVVGPASSTDGTIARFNGTTGKLIKNNPSTIVNADVNSVAAIAFSKMAALTASRVPVLDPSGFVVASSTTATQLGFLDATSSIQTQLDSKQATMSVVDTNSIDMTLTGGTAIKGDVKISTQIPTAGAFNAITTIETDGLHVQTPAYANTPQNLSLAVSFAAGAMTISFKTAAGNNASTASPVIIPIRSNSLTAGTYDVVSITNALSITVPSGATLGLNSGGAGYVYVSAIDNAGTCEISVNSQWLSDSVITTTAIGTGSDTAGDYSTSARTAVGARMVARLQFNTAPNGTWASTDKFSLGDDVSLKPVGNILSALSNAVTPGATNQYTQFTGNSITLQPGFWSICAEASGNNGGSSPAYTTFMVGVFGANGNNTTTLPASITAVTGVTVIGAYVGNSFATPAMYVVSNSATQTAASISPVVIYTNQSATIYAVCRGTETTAANARLSVAINATPIF